MSEDEQSVGERRRRRDAERAAREAAEQRPLTRRELRAREAALQTGAIEIDATGEVRVIRDEPAPGPVSAATPAEPAGTPSEELTDTAGLSRRQLRELRDRQEAATGAPAAEPTPQRGVPEPAPTPPPTPPLRRPVVRPPAATGAMRSLAEDGTGLTPVVRDEPQQPKDDPAATGALTAVDPHASVDVTDMTVRTEWKPSEPTAATESAVDAAQTVSDPGPLPTTRRSRRVAADRQSFETGDDAAGPGAGPALTAAAAAPSLDKLLAGEDSEPEPFDARPSWVELPPPTPAGPFAVVERKQPDAPTEVTPAVSAPAAAAAAPRAQAAESPYVDDDGDEDDEDEHRTPIWLSGLMVLVLVVIGVVLGLLVWRMTQGDNAAGAVATAMMDVTSPMGLKGWMT